MNNFGPNAVIHLDRLKENIRQIKGHVKDIPLCCVVKANAYGHGVIPVSKALIEEGISLLAVFSFEEALEIRHAGIHANILIFSRINPKNLQTALDQDFILNLSSLDDLEPLLAFDLSHGKSPRFHIKFDTGMTRLGLDEKDAEPLFKVLSDNPQLRYEGIYSHFATADEGDLSYAKHQLSTFNSILKKADRFGVEFDYIHCSNSGAIFNLPDARFNLIRVGMLMYGALPSDEVPKFINIKPVMNFMGTVVNIRFVPKGTPVSYGGQYVTTRDTMIGVIQIGFADGFPRPWYVEGVVGYKGEEYKIAGRVCMDSFMVDFGDTKPVVGDQVLIFGETKENHIPVERIANTIDSTTYVLLTAIGGRTEYIFSE